MSWSAFCIPCDFIGSSLGKVPPNRSPRFNNLSIYLYIYCLCMQGLYIIVNENTALIMIYLDVYLTGRIYRYIDEVVSLFQLQAKSLLLLPSRFCFYWVDIGGWFCSHPGIPEQVLQSWRLRLWTLLPQRCSPQENGWVGYPTNTVESLSGNIIIVWMPEELWM